MGDSRTTAALVSKVTISVPPNTQVLDLSFVDSSPARAQKGAAAFAQAYVDFKRTQAAGVSKSIAQGISQQVTDLDKQLQDVSGKLASSPINSPDRAAAQARQNVITGQLANLRTQLATLNSIQIDPGNVIEPATLPTSQTSPVVPLNVAVGIALGLLVGVLGGFVKDRRDHRLRSVAELERRLGLPVLAAIPRRRSKGPEVVALSEPDGEVADGYGRLHAVLAAQAGRGQPTSILVATPSAPGRPAMVVAANLAVLLAASEFQVVLASADLRGAMKNPLFGLDARPGLSDVLVGNAELTSVIGHPDEIPSLGVLPSGSPVRQPAPLLYGEALASALAQLRATADTVIVVAPPPLAVSDALAFAPLVDGVLLVATAHETTRDDLAEARSQLEQAGAGILGVVMVGVRSRSDMAHRRDLGTSPAEPSRAGVNGSGSARRHLGPAPGAPSLEGGPNAAPPAAPTPTVESDEQPGRSAPPSALWTPFEVRRERRRQGRPS